jgi:chromosome segregation ATPase
MLVQKLGHLIEAILSLTDAVRHLGKEDGNCCAVLLRNIDCKLDKIMATQAEVAADLRIVLAQQKKTIEEIKDTQSKVDALKAKIVELEAVIAAGSEVNPELLSAVADVKAAAQAADDAIPDLPAPPPTPTP